MVADIVHLSAVRAARQDAAALSARELASINALLAYTAQDRKIQEDIVRQAVTSRFGVDDITKIPSNVFEEAVRFLVDLQVDMIMN